MFINFMPRVDLVKKNQESNKLESFIRDKKIKS